MNLAEDALEVVFMMQQSIHYEGAETKMDTWKQRKQEKVMRENGVFESKEMSETEGCCESREDW